MKKSFITKNIVMLLVLVIILSNWYLPLSFAADNNLSINKAADNVVSYQDYLHKNSGMTFNKSIINVDLSMYKGLDNSVKLQKSLYGYDGAVLTTEEEGYVELPFTVLNDGLYTIGIEYYPMPGNGESIERTIEIDNTVPFNEAMAVSFSRIWQDAGAITKDIKGNENRPGQVEAPQWRKAYISDYFGYYGDALYFALHAGNHKIKLVSVSEPIAIKAVTLQSADISPLPYEQKLTQLMDKGLKAVSGVLNGGYEIKQAEQTYQKSDPMLYPTADRTSAGTQPFDYSKIRLNTIGGTNWQNPGQWITWEIIAPEEGLYNIALRSRQNFVNGQYVKRTIYINGETPFAEAANLNFNYSDDWVVKALGNEKTPYLFHLNKGKNEITLKVTLGDMEKVISRAENSLKELNNAYFQLLTVMGVQPDIYRDYKIDVYQPQIIEIFKKQYEEIIGIAADFENKTNQKADKTAVLHEIAFQLKKMSENAGQIVNIFAAFKDNIGAFGNWITSARMQPLQLDYIVLSEQSAKLPQAEKGFFENFKYQVVQFVASFYADYDLYSAQANGNKTVTVWIGNGVTGGRDQAQILRQLITNGFTAKNSINVNLQLISAGTLLPATLAGKGPDVALQIGGSDPVNYAMRKAVIDLTEFSDYKEVAGRFYPSATEPFSYSYNGHNGVYALPETQAFPILFYRSDILNKIGIDPSSFKTWKDIIGTFPQLGKNHMQFGMPSTIGMFGTLLYQNKEEFYKNEGRLSNLDSKVSLETFKTWSNYYAKYGIPLTYNFENRFRSGEMPIGISDYTSYNLLSVSAPEIRGLWSIAPVPGTYDADGKLNSTVASSGAGAIIMANTKDKSSCWEFIKWWTDADAQVAFGKELESIIGTAARYNTANIQALQRLPWPAKDRKVLNEQWSNTRGIPEVPGGYQTARYLDFALRSVIVANAEPRTTLLNNVMPINEEIKTQRKELNLN